MSVIESIILYASVMLITGILVYVSKLKKNNLIWRYSFLILGLLPLFFIMAFRYDVGTDYFHGYIPGFKNIALGYVGFDKEPGFYLINKLIQVFTLQSQWLIITTSFIYVLFLGLTLDEESVNPIMSLFVLFGSSLFFVALNNIRQQLAIIFILWGFRFVLKKNFWGFLGICVASAYFFHLSSIMMVFVYPFVNSKTLRKYFYIWMPIGLFLVPILVEVYIKVMIFLGYGDYLESFIGTVGNKVLLLQNIVISIILLIGFGLKRIKEDKKIYGYTLMQYVALLISILTYFLKLIEINERVCFYFMIFQVLSIPLSIHLMNKESKIMALLMVIIIVSLGLHCFYDSIYLNGYHEVLPYKFVFGHLEELKVVLPEEKLKFVYFMS